MRPFQEKTYISIGFNLATELFFQVNLKNYGRFAEENIILRNW